MNNEQHPSDTTLSTTDLAVRRTALAAERTLMAWVRTSISMISFGFTIFKFFQYLIQAEGGKRRHLIGPQELALILITLGTLILIAAIIEHRQFINSLERPEIQKFTLGVMVAFSVILIGIWAFINVVVP